MTGRPSKLTPDLVEDLTREIATGMPYALVRERLGITYQTFNEWRHGRFPKSAPAELREHFSESLKRAEAQLCYELLVVIKAHSVSDLPGDWRSVAWVLERRFPQYFGRHGRSTRPGRAQPMASDSLVR